MAEKKLMSGGLDKMVDIALKHNNFALSYKLSEILLTEGGVINEKSFGDLLKLGIRTKSDDDILSCAKIGHKLGFLTPEVLKKQIFPNIHNWPELVVTSLEEVSLIEIIKCIKYFSSPGWSGEGQDSDTAGGVSDWSGQHRGSCNPGRHLL